MSTAPPLSVNTEVELAVLMTERADQINADQVPNQAHGVSAHGVSVSEPDGDVDIDEFSSESLNDTSLNDTQTYHLDETDLGLPSVSSPVSSVSIAPEPVLAPDGTLILQPPVSDSPLDGMLYAVAKRSLDIVLSGLMLVLLSPLLFISAILVKLTDGGAIFYPHTRVGAGGNEFTCYKFRSMVVNAEQMKATLAFYNSHDDHRTFKIPDDPRVTPIGRWMRRTSVDELPQLWNVFKGEMSIVGPRPPVVSEVEKYTLDDMQRLTVKPGLTCIWQVSGRSRLPFPEQLKMDLQYIENRSILLDLKLIALTIPAVLSADGAY